MKIAIISDTHDNIPNLEKFLAWSNNNKIGMIIHCGDIAAPDIIEEIVRPSFVGPIHLVHGNVSNRDFLEEVCDNLKQTTLHGDEGYIEIDHLKLAFCHYPEKARELAQTNNYNFVFYGHTHKPWIENVGNIIIANPGTLGGIFSKATFSVLDTQNNNLELKILEKI